LTRSRLSIDTITGFRTQALVLGCEFRLRSEGRPPVTDLTSLSPEHHALIKKLQSIAPLSDEEMRELVSLPLNVKHVGPDIDIAREGDRPSECCLIAEGFLCRYKFTAEGRRQIFSFHIAGDIPDLQSLELKVMDHYLGTLTPAKVAFIPHQSVLHLMSTCTRIARVLWRDTLIDAAVFREWMMGIGRRSAVTRIAHVLCEIFVRLRAVGLAGERECVVPLTQAEFGDALGLSTVHVNRSLQELRGRGLIRLSGGVLTILDWAGLEAMGEFDLTYLHLDGSPGDIGPDTSTGVRS
jgi:CRP-like cAMP-binding protein